MKPFRKYDGLRPGLGCSTQRRLPIMRLQFAFNFPGANFLDERTFSVSTSATFNFSEINDFDSKNARSDLRQV